MLTPEQEQWINSLSERLVVIVPFDERTERLFYKVKKDIQNLLGSEVIVEHVGASSFGISGQDEIDVSVVANKDKFDEYILKLETLYGSVQSRYDDRARFEVKIEDKKIDLKIVDGQHPSYLKGKLFEKYLRSHPNELERYRILKEDANGQTIKEYYRRKVEFMNEILSKA